MINIKSDQDIILYRETGKIAAEILTILKDHVKAGVDTYTIAKYAEELIINKYQAIPHLLGSMILSLPSIVPSIM
jgi:methionyl aminopeptidase